MEITEYETFSINAFRFGKFRRVIYIFFPLCEPDFIIIRRKNIIKNFQQCFRKIYDIFFIKFIEILSKMSREFPVRFRKDLNFEFMWINFGEGPKKISFWTSVGIFSVNMNKFLIGYIIVQILTKMYESGLLVWTIYRCLDSLSGSPDCLSGSLESLPSCLDSLFDFT